MAKVYQLEHGQWVEVTNLIDEVNISIEKIGIQISEIVVEQPNLPTQALKGVVIANTYLEFAAQTANYVNATQDTEISHMVNGVEASLLVAAAALGAVAATVAILGLAPIEALGLAAFGLGLAATQVGKIADLIDEYTRDKPGISDTLNWRAPIRWSGLIVSASWASGPSGQCFPARAGGSPERYAA